ncbi:MAG: hypothetical protein JWN62_4436 [Acidimicrobiales bacterium]|nr:hypothetical protein [Acidimicrobiales bacterium]
MVVGHIAGCDACSARSQYRRPVTEPTIRAAREDDFAAMATIATDGDSHADDPYFAFVAAQGSLRVATTDDGTIVAFGGTIPVGESTTMLTDLFVTPACRGRRIGSALLDALFAGAPRRMTFSSKHAAALPAYRRAGMTPSWRLLYLRGSAPDGLPEQLAGASAHGAGSPAPVDSSDDRPELADCFRSLGAVVRPGSIVLADADGVNIVRLRDRRGADAFDELLASFAPGTPVSCCVPEHSPVAFHASAIGFVVVEHDVFCASPGVEIPVDLHCLHPGLV